MDFKNQRESDNFVDRTDDTPAERFLTNLAAAFNPVTAYRKTSRAVQDKLIRSGVYKPAGVDEMLAQIDAEIQKRHAFERAHPPKGFIIDDQGILIPVGPTNANGLTPQEQEVILRRSKNKK